MTNHVHMIFGSNQDRLEDIIRDMKKHTSSALKAAITTALVRVPRTIKQHF